MSLREEFERLSTEEISSFPALAKEEHLQLDFKIINNASLNSGEDKKSLAKCVSGFANSSGGIVIWGIDARKNDQGIDRALAVAEIAQLGLFFSRLNELSTQASSPSVDGIIHRKFETSLDNGFVASFIPDSDSGPHMAKLGENRYYKRNGQRFLQLEHYDLEDMFGRRQRPNLEISITNRRHPINAEQEDLEISILNVGKGIAKYVGFFAEIVGANIVNSGTNFKNVSGLNPGRQMFSYENNISVLHPNGIRTMLGTVTFQPTITENIRLTLKCYCENMQLKSKDFSIALEPRLEPETSNPES